MSCTVLGTENIAHAFKELKRLAGKTYLWNLM